MGSALAHGLLLTKEAGLRLTVYDKVGERSEALAHSAGGRVEVAPSAPELIRGAEVIILSVKPQDLEAMLEGLRPELGREKTLMSVAAGLDLERLRAAAGPESVLFRLMPNLAVASGSGVVAVAHEAAISSEAVAGILGLLEGLGAVSVLPESQFDAVTAVAASGPAMLALVLEGLEDGGVSAGLPRSVARLFVQQMALGTARTLLDNAESPAALKDRVTSPAGTTIAGLAVLEDRGVRGALLQAVRAAVRRAAEL